MFSGSLVLEFSKKRVDKRRERASLREYEYGANEDYQDHDRHQPPLFVLFQEAEVLRNYLYFAHFKLLMHFFVIDAMIRRFFDPVRIPLLFEV